MKKGICPKCNSSEVYFANSANSLDAGIRAGESQPQIQIRKSGANIFDKPNRFPFTNYICKSCGYTESYLNDSEALSRLPESLNWKKMQS